MCASGRFPEHQVAAIVSSVSFTVAFCQEEFADLTWSQPEAPPFSIYF